MKAKIKSPKELNDKEDETHPLDQVDMEVEITKDELSKEEMVMKILMQEWRNIDDRFIPDDQKSIYKEDF